MREVLATEMLEALGVNTSKTFALFETGEALERGDEPSPTRSSVLTRLSHGHIRIGTFQRLAFFGEVDNIKKLVRYCLENLYGEHRRRRWRECAAAVRSRQRGDGAARRVLHRRRLRPRRAQQRQYQHHRRELRLRPVALHARLGSGLHRRLFRPLRPLRLRPPARGDPLGPGAARRLPVARRRSTAAVGPARRLERAVRASARRRDASPPRRCGATRTDRELAAALDHGAGDARGDDRPRLLRLARRPRSRRRRPIRREPFRDARAGARRSRQPQSHTHIGPTRRPARCTSTRSRRSGRRSPKRDDWQPFEDKVRAIRRMGEAMEQDAPAA